MRRAIPPPPRGTSLSTGTTLSLPWQGKLLMPRKRRCCDVEMLVRSVGWYRALVSASFRIISESDLGVL
jgi:hypothetical protein